MIKTSLFPSLDRSSSGRTSPAKLSLHGVAHSTEPTIEKQPATSASTLHKMKNSHSNASINKSNSNKSLSAYNNTINNNNNTTNNRENVSTIKGSSSTINSNSNDYDYEKMKKELKKEICEEMREVIREELGMLLQKLGK